MSHWRKEGNGTVGFTEVWGFAGFQEGDDACCLPYVGDNRAGHGAVQDFCVEGYTFVANVLEHNG